METYNLHDTAPAPRRSFYRRVRRAASCRNAMKICGGIVAAVGLFILFRGMVWSHAPEENLSLAAPQTNTRVSVTNSLPTSAFQKMSKPISGPIRSARKPNVQAHGWRRMGGNFGPAWGGFGVGMGTGREFVDLFDIMDQLTVFEDMEDMLASRRKVRQEYENELERLREERRRRREGVAPENENADKSMTTADATAVSRPVDKKEIQIDTPVGLQKFSSSWNIPSLQQQHDENTYRYVLDVQGMDRDNLKLSLQDRIMIVEGENMVKTENGYHSSSFKRSFTLPFDADLQSLTSSELADGNLLLQANKLQSDTAAPVREIAIERLPSETADGADAINNSIERDENNGDGVVEDIPVGGSNDDVTENKGTLSDDASI